MRFNSQTPIHDFFGLSYASYLVLPRTLLQSCSVETQTELCAALEKVYQEEKNNMGGQHWPHKAEIHVQLRESGTGRFTQDPLANYERGRRRLWPMPPASSIAPSSQVSAPSESPPL